MKKKILLLLICCLMITTPLISNAKSFDIKEKAVLSKVEIVPKEVVEADFERQINEILDQKREKVEPMAGDYYYTSKVVQIKKKWLYGDIPGGQPRDGTRFSQPGGFSYSPSGGPTSSGSVEFSVPFKLFTFSIDVGTAQATSVGYNIAVPNTTDFFLLVVDSEVETRQINIYRQLTPSSPKILDSIYYTSTVVRRSLDVVEAP